MLYFRMDAIALGRGEVMSTVNLYARAVLHRHALTLLEDNCGLLGEAAKMYKEA